MSTPDTREAFEAWCKLRGIATCQGGLEEYSNPGANIAWRAWQAATEAAKSFIHADELIGLPVSMDVSTGDDDADHRIFGKVIATMPSEDGITILAEEESRNFSEAAKATEPKLSVELPEGDDRKVTVFWHEVKDGVRHVCITVDDAKATGTAGEIDADAEMSKVKRDVELMGVGFLVDGKRCSLDRITWFNRPGDTWLPPPPGYPTEAARQLAPVVAVKTWQERMDQDPALLELGALHQENADLRAALAATAAPVLSDEQILQIWAGYRSSAVAKGGMIPDPIEFARAILAATNRSQP